MRSGSASARVARFEGERTYAVAPERAWLILADTEHMNRVLGLPAMVAEVAPSSPGNPRRASARLRAGLCVRWVEHPYEWVERRRWSVRRDFENGPFRAVTVATELHAADGAASPPRTTVRVRFEFVPAGALGRIVVARVGPRSVESVLRYCDAALGTAGARPQATPATAGARVDAGRLAAGVDRLAAEGFGAPLRERLERRLRDDTDERVLRMQPFAAADEWGADRVEVLRLFLHATRAGLLTLRWELMCPVCRVPKDEVESLSALPERFHCDTCGIDYETDFERRVELRFSVHPAVRDARDTVHCLGSPGRTPHRLIQLSLAPAEVRDVAVAAMEPLELKVLGTPRVLRIHAEGSPPSGDARTITYMGDVWQVDGAAVFEAPIVVPRNAVLRVANASPHRAVVVVERERWDPLAATAAEVTTLQDFRDLFSSEALAPGQEMGVSSLTVLFTDLKASTTLYERVGDAPAFGRVNRHFEYLRERVAARRGAVVKTIGDAVMAVFQRADDALAAAVDMQAGLADWCADRGIEPPLVLKMGVHHGPVIAVNANGRLDYFGRTVNVAARLGRESAGGDVVLLRELWEAPLLRAELPGRPLRVETFRAELRGIEGARELVRVRLETPPDGGAET